jgi:hypothetical protein
LPLGAAFAELHAGGSGPAYGLDVGDAVDERIDEIVVDAYGEYEQLSSFRQGFEDEAGFPFRGRVVGVDVDVLAVDFDGDERRGLIAVCPQGRARHTVSLLDVEPVGLLAAETRLLLAVGFDLDDILG